MFQRVFKFLFLLAQLAVFLQAEEVAVPEAIAPAVEEIYVCESGEPAFLGTYTQSKARNDGAPVYNNANDMSFFRSKGFWYLGDLA